MEVLEHPLVQSLTRSALQITNKLNRWTNGKQPILDRVIKICGWSTIAFIVTQIGRRIWYTVYHKIKKYPTGPIGYPFFGCFWNLVDPNDFEKFYVNIGASYPTIAMYPLGPKNYEAIISDLKLVNKLSKLAAFSNRPVHIAETDFPTSFEFIHGGKEWSHRRKLFYNSILKITDSEYMTKYVQSNIKDKIVVPSIEEAIAKNNGVWQPEEALFHYAFSTVFGASFGPNVIISADDETYKSFLEVTKFLFTKVIWYFLLPIFSVTAMRKFQQYMKPHMLKQRAIMSQWIKNKGDSTKEDRSYIDMMMEANIKQEVAISDIQMTFRVGTHTTAGSVQLMLFRLAQNPDIQQKVYLELRSLFKNADDITVVDPKVLNNAHYLRALIEESFRVRTLSGLPRQMTEDFRVDFVNKDGKKDYYILPKGCSIRFNHAHMFRTEDNGWKNGNEWNVNNYLDENDKFVRTNKNFDDRFKMSIFGFGRRVCPGINLARKEVMFALAILVYKYEFCGPKGKGDVDFVIPPELPLRTVKNAPPFTVIKRK